jgi:hypothetical protein
MLTNDLLAKLVVIAVLLIGLIVWRALEREQPTTCHSNCPTDFSASRK